MCEPHYVNLFFFVNLLHSLFVWLFDIWHLFWTIWHLFDNLTSFWHFDFSFNLNHLSPSQGYFLHWLVPSTTSQTLLEPTTYHCFLIGHYHSTELSSYLLFVSKHMKFNQMTNLKGNRMEYYRLCARVSILIFIKVFLCYSFLSVNFSVIQSSSLTFMVSLRFSACIFVVYM